MEDSCPATPLVLTGRDSKSPLQIAISSPESDGMKSPSSGSPDSRCVICLGRLQNKSFTDSCLHQFCFQCLLQWSKIKAECPLCKQPFKSIIHNVRSNLDYDQYHVEHGEPRYALSDLMHSYNFDLIPVDRRFRYRSTMTREYFRELAESLLAHTRRLPENTYQINPLVPVDPESTQSVHPSTRLNPHGPQYRTRQRGTSDFRRNIYAQDLWVQNLVDLTGRYRECSPQFYRENPAQIHRIIPWLNREVNVLLSDCESHAAYVLSRIISMLTQYSIRSREFKEQIQTYFGDRTDHFIHELYTFARSVYDIAGFDQNAVYGTNPNYAMEVQEISSSSGNDNDSDIEVLETVKREERKSKKSRQGLKKFLLKRAGEEETKSEEPVAGPSGVGGGKKTTDSIDICESDTDEVKILHYVKPEPEVVTLSSGEEAPAYSDRDLSHGEYAEVIHSENNKKPFNDDEKRKTRTRSGKGKCKSDGFGLKGKQKGKYMKSRKQRSSSISSISSSSSSSSSTSRTSSSSSSSSRSRSRSTNSNSSYESRKGKSECSVSSKSSHRSSSKSKKKKSKISRKKFKKKTIHKRHKSTSDTEKKKKKRVVKSCVIVPSWSSESSPSLTNKRGRYEWKPPKSYWSIALNDMPKSSKEREKGNGKRKHRHNLDEEKWRKKKMTDNTSDEVNMSTSCDTLSPGSANVPSSSGSLSFSSSSQSFPYSFNSQDSENSD